MYGKFCGFFPKQITEKIRCKFLEIQLPNPSGETWEEEEGQKKREDGFLNRKRGRRREHSVRRSHGHDGMARLALLHLLG